MDFGSGYFGDNRYYRTNLLSKLILINEQFTIFCPDEQIFIIKEIHKL